MKYIIYDKQFLILIYFQIAQDILFSVMELDAQ